MTAEDDHQVPSAEAYRMEAEQAMLRAIDSANLEERAAWREIASGYIKLSRLAR